MGLRLGLVIGLGMGIICICGFGRPWLWMAALGCSSHGYDGPEMCPYGLVISIGDSSSKNLRVLCSTPTPAEQDGLYLHCYH